LTKEEEDIINEIHKTVQANMNQFVGKNITSNLHNQINYTITNIQRNLDQAYGPGNYQIQPPSELDYLNNTLTVIVTPKIEYIQTSTSMSQDVQDVFLQVMDPELLKSHPLEKKKTLLSRLDLIKID
jgi:hypothetical protein